MKPPRIKYTYRGQVERGNGKGYGWQSGYSETGPAGETFFPWMTERECQQDARKRGTTAFFVYPKPNLPPLSDDLKACAQSQFQPEDIRPW